MAANPCAAADARRQAPGACSVEVVDDYASFVDLEAEWNEAVARADVPHPFLSHAWLRTWWDCFGTGARLHILVVRSAGRIMAIAPLMREVTRMYGIRVRCIRMMQNDHTPRADFIVAGPPEESYRAIWHALSAQRGSWDVLQISQVPHASATLGTMAGLAEAGGLITGTWPSGQSPYLELRGTWDDYAGGRGLSAKFRSNLRNRLSRLARLGSYSLEVIDDAGGVAAARGDAIRLEASGWKADAGTAITSDGAVRRFYTQLAESARLRVLFLTVNGRRIATAYGSVHAGRLFLVKTGYDPEYAKCSPFKLLMYLAVRRAYAEGLAEIDFLGDAEPWKLEWTSTVRAHDWLFVFSESARAHLVHRAKFQLAPAVHPMASASRRMYVPTFQGLSPFDLLKAARRHASGYPFTSPHALRFYRARNAIYYLCGALRATGVQREPGRPLTVLAPDYNSGNEIAAIEAAGAQIRYYTVDRRMQADPQDVARLCDRHRPDVLYVIHYLGWPQPMPALVALCRQRGILIVEDCALSLLSGMDGQALGTFGDWSIFCLYKTLPVPNGALLVQNTTRLLSLEHLPLREVGAASVLGRMAELMVQRVRSRVDGVGAALQAVKGSLGRAAGAMDINRARIGDIGFDLGDVDLRMSPISERLLQRFDFAEIRRRRADNCHRLSDALDGHVTRAWPDGSAGLPDGVCPLFLPILVPDKGAAADTLRRQGIEALEFWNHGVPACDNQASNDARFLRAHVLGLPVHQDLGPRHLTYMADVVSRLPQMPR